MSDLKELKLEDLEVGMYVEASQLVDVRGVYILLDIGTESHALNGRIVLIAENLSKEVSDLAGQPNIGVFYQPEYRTLGGLSIYE